MTTMCHINLVRDQRAQGLWQHINAKSRSGRTQPVALIGYANALESTSKRIGIKVYFQQPGSACRCKNFCRCRKPDTSAQKMRAIDMSGFQGRTRNTQAPRHSAPFGDVRLNELKVTVPESAVKSP